MLKKDFLIKTQKTLYYMIAVIPFFRRGVYSDSVEGFSFVNVVNGVHSFTSV